MKLKIPPKTTLFLLFISLLFNLTFYRTNQLNSIHGTGTFKPEFNRYGGKEFSITASGYSVFNRKELHSKDLFQFFFIRIDKIGTQTSCQIFDIWEWIYFFEKRIHVSTAESCQVLSSSFEDKLASIQYKDVVLQITENEVTFTSKDAKEAGGGSLMSGLEVPR